MPKMILNWPFHSRSKPYFIISFVAHTPPPPPRIPYAPLPSTQSHIRILRVLHTEADFGGRINYTRHKRCWKHTICIMKVFFYNWIVFFQRLHCVSEPPPLRLHTLEKRSFHSLQKTLSVSITAITHRVLLFASLFFHFHFTCFVNSETRKSAFRWQRTRRTQTTLQKRIINFVDIISKIFHSECDF